MLKCSSGLFSILILQVLQCNCYVLSSLLKAFARNTPGSVEIDPFCFNCSYSFQARIVVYVTSGVYVIIYTGSTHTSQFKPIPVATKMQITKVLFVVSVGSPMFALVWGRSTIVIILCYRSVAAIAACSRRFGWKHLFLLIVFVENDLVF